jgi:hypothetical protein
MGAQVSLEPGFFGGSGTLEGLKTVGGPGTPGAPLTFGGPGTLRGLETPEGPGTLGA